MADLTDAVGDGNQRCLLTAGCRNQCRFPAELQIEAGIGAADEKDEAEVASANIERPYKNAATNGTHNNWKYDVEGGFLKASGCVCHTASKCVGDGVGWSLNEIGGELVKFKCLHDLHCALVSDYYMISWMKERWTYRWQKVLEALRRDEREMHEAEVPGKGVFSCFLYSIPSPTDSFVRPAVRDLRTVLRHLGFFLCQPFRVVGPRREKKVGGCCYGDRCRAFDDEKPLPCVKAGDFVHIFENSGG